MSAVAHSHAAFSQPRPKTIGSAGAYAPVVLSQVGQKDAASPQRSLAYVLGNMLSAGGKSQHPQLIATRNPNVLAVVYKQAQIVLVD